MLEINYTSIILQSATDIGRTNLLELGLPTEEPLIALKPYSVLLTYREFMDQEIKQLEELGIISRSMIDWASLILIVLKKDERPNSSMSNSTKSKTEFNLRLCINYRKLNSHIVTAKQIKSDGNTGKVIANYLLPTINTLLARFEGCKYFYNRSKSGCYHIRLSKEAAEKTTFIVVKSKWIFHSLPFGINIGPSSFSYVLGKVLSSCLEVSLNCLDDKIILSKTWKDHLQHPEEVFKR